MALTKLTSNLIEGGTGTDWVTAIQTSNFTAAAGKGYFVNTTSQVLYVNLPVGVVGMEITIQDYAGTFATNKVILNANGSEKIQGSALEGKINTNNATAVLIYQDAIKGWTSQDVTVILPPLTVEYLVVAGGGGGGGNVSNGNQNSGGGGAGGYLTNYSGTALTLSIGTNYSVTVGASGAGAIGTSVRAGNGSNSSFTSSIISTGGGSGGSQTASFTPRIGGSGGGGSTGSFAGAGGTSGEGNAGATTSGYGSSGGGGGGAGGVGQGTNLGTGGVGLPNNINGANQFYGGGGGGSMSNGGGAGGAGGNGGGGSGATSSGTTGTSGIPNTGGGGGGGYGNGGNGGAGGSGIVILRYSNSFTISGLSGTTTIVGSDKVTTFTNVGTGNIQFN